MIKSPIQVAIMLLCSFLLSIYTSAPVVSNSDRTQIIQGLDGTIIIQFDAYQIPQIYASTAEDLFFAQGYIHASARWWQMEWYRHSGQGRLAELVGSSAIPDDTLMHTLQIPDYAARDAATVSGDSARLLDAYIQGINTWIEDKSPDELAPEYALLGIASNAVDAWQREDSMVLQSLQALSFNETSLLSEILSGLIRDEVGSLFINAILPPYPYDTFPVTMRPGLEMSQSNNLTTLLTQFRSLDIRATTDIVGSNAWVVSGDLTETGMPLLANDTHMGIRMPSYWYQVGLHCIEINSECPYNVAGVSIPGSPGIIIGHNQSVAWGFTNAQTDMIDLYQLELNPEQPDQYLYNDDYVEMNVETITLNVRDSEPVDITTRTTILGPVIEQLDDINLPHAYSLRWAIADGNRVIDAIFASNQATDWESFQSAFSLFDAPGLNVFYADVEGNIGYLLSGHVPIRADGHTGQLPVSGIDDTYAWQGYVDPMELPRLFNPEQGYILSANNAMVTPEDFPHPIAYFYDYGFRAQRLNDLIRQYPTHSIETFRQIQLDTYHPAAEFMLPVLNSLVWEEAIYDEMVNWLMDWDKQNEIDSAQATLFNVFLSNVVQYGLDELPLYEASHTTYLLSVMIDNSNHPLWLNTNMGFTSRDQVLKRAFMDAYDQLVLQFGSNHVDWLWGDLHQIYFEPELLDYISLDDALIDQLMPSIPVPGTLATVNVSNFNPISGTFNATSLPSMRMILDLADFNQSLFINSTGQHGDYRSPHYTDMISLWGSGEYIDYTFAIETEAE